MHIDSFLSCGFITTIVVNSPERKLANCTSVQKVIMSVQWEAGYAHFLDLLPLDLKIFRRAYRDELCEKCIGIDNCYGESENRIETTASG